MKNEPAFPNAINGVPTQTGMTLRNWFAGRAMLAEREKGRDE